MEPDEEVPRRKARPWFVAAIAVILVAIIGVLVERGAREKRQRVTRQTMQNDLTLLRNAIRDFRREKHRPPRTLQELVTARYVRAIPSDPVTDSPNWHLITEQPVHADDFSRRAPPTSAATGIVDVRSSAPGTDANGKSWSEY